MQGLLLLICIVILIVVLTIKSDVSAALKALREKVNFLDQEVQRLRHLERVENEMIMPHGMRAWLYSGSPTCTNTLLPSQLC